MTVNEAENKLRSRACATGVASWMWNYDVEDGTITLSLTAGITIAASVPAARHRVPGVSTPLDLTLVQIHG